MAPPLGGWGAITFYYLHRVFHIIERDIRHNAVAQIKYETLLVLHTVEQAIYALFNYFFISIQYMRVKVTLNGYTCR